VRMNTSPLKIIIKPVLLNLLTYLNTTRFHQKE
jgi:hypothetical protein